MKGGNNTIKRKHGERNDFLKNSDKAPKPPKLDQTALRTVKAPAQVLLARAHPEGALWRGALKFPVKIENWNQSHAQRTMRTHMHC